MGHRHVRIKRSLKGLIDWHRAGTETDFQWRLPAISVPLIIHGDGDLERISERGRGTAAVLGSPVLPVKGYMKERPRAIMFCTGWIVSSWILAFIKG